jgi:hypothetical protein
VEKHGKNEAKKKKKAWVSQVIGQTVQVACDQAVKGGMGRSG